MGTSGSCGDMEPIQCDGPGVNVHLMRHIRTDDVHLMAVSHDPEHQPLSAPEVKVLARNVIHSYLSVLQTKDEVQMCCEHVESQGFTELIEKTRRGLEKHDLLQMLAPLRI